MMKKNIQIPTERKWYVCPHCGKSLVIYEDTAVCKGVFIRCKECRREIEIKV